MFHWITKPNSLTGRITFLSLIGIVILMLIAGHAIRWSFNQSVERSLESHLVAYIDILIATTSLDDEGIVTFQSDGVALTNLPRVWQVNVGDQPAQKSPLLDEWIDYSHIDPSDTRYFNFRNRDGTRFYSVQKTLLFPGDQSVSYFFGMPEDIAEAFIEQEHSIFTSVLVPTLIGLGGALLILTFIQIKLSIWPLKGIETSLRNVRSGKTERLNDDFLSEIQPLADEVNTLLDYSSGVVERHRTFASNLAHALKTPLSILRNEARNESSAFADEVKEKGDIMLALIERNLARVKAAGTGNILGARTEVKPALERITRSFGKLHHKQIRLTSDDDLYFRGDEGDFYEMLGNIIENACKYGKEKIAVSAEVNDEIVITIEDDGPGIPESVRAHVLERGARLDETKPGIGIGLSVTHDIVALYNGTISLSDSPLGGLKVILVLPSVE